MLTVGVHYPAMDRGFGGSGRSYRLTVERLCDKEGNPRPGACFTVTFVGDPGDKQEGGDSASVCIRNNKALDWLLDQLQAARRGGPVAEAPSNGLIYVAHGSFSDE